MTAPATLPFSVEAGMNIRPLVQAAQAAHRELASLLDFGKKNGTLSLTLKLAGQSSAQIKKDLQAAVTAQPLPLHITFDKARLGAAVASLQNSLKSVVGVDVSTIKGVQAALNVQIAELNKLIGSLRSAASAVGTAGGGAGTPRTPSGGGNPALSANTKQLLSDLEALNNEFKRGDKDAEAYAIQLAGLQSALRVAASGATQGTAEFKALDRAVTVTVAGMRNVETANINQLVTQLKGARAEFDHAAASAKNLAQQEAAIGKYEGEINKVRVALQGMAASGKLTEQQLGKVNGLLGQTARESATINKKVNIAGLSGNITNALQDLTRYIPGVNALGGSLAGIPPAMMGIVAAGAALTAGLAASFRTAAEFQQSMADIKALTGAQGEELEKLGELAKNYGLNLGIGATKAADAVLSLSKAGLSAAEIAGGGLAAALNLAAAAGIETAKAGDLAVTAWTAFGQQDDLSHIADVYANFANKTTLAAEDLGQALAAVGPVAKGAGIDLQEFSGYMATLAQGGFKNMSDAGTSLKTMLLSLQSPSSTAGEAMRTIGLNVYDASGKMIPFAQTMDTLREKLKGLSEQQRNAVLKDMFGTDGIRAAKIFYDQTTESINDNVEAMGKQGSAAQVAKDRMSTYKGAVAQLGANFEALKVEIGEKLLPVATKLVQFANDLTGGFRHLLNDTKQLTGYLIMLGTAALGFAGPAVIANIGAIGTALTGVLGTAMKFVAANPFGILATAVAALGIAVNKLYSDINNIYAEMDKSEQQSSDQLMKRVAELRKQGGELANTQAKYLLALEQAQQAQQGRITGVNIWGERQYAVDPEEVKRTQARVAELRKELTALQLEAQRRGDPKATTTDATGIDPDRVAEQSKALDTLRDQLGTRMDALDSGLPPKLEGKIKAIQKAYKKMLDDFGEPYTGNFNNAEYLKGKKELEEAQAKEIAAVTAKFREDERKKTEEAQAKLREIVVRSQQETEQSRINAMQDGAAKRAAQRQLDIAKVQEDSQKEAAALAGDPKAQAARLAAGRQQVTNMKREWAAEDRKREEENAAKVQEIVTASTRATEQARIDLMEDGANRRAAQRQLDIRKVEEDAQKEAAAQTGNPAAARAILEAAHQTISNMKTAWAAEDRKREEDNAREIADIHQQTLFARQRFEISMMQEGSVKRKQQLDLDLAELRADTARRVEEAKGNAEKIEAIKQSETEKVHELYAQYRADEEAASREHARKLLEYAVQSLQDRQKVVEAQQAAAMAQFELSLARSLEAVKGNDLATGEVELAGVKRRAALLEEQARTQEAAARKQADLQRDIALAADNLTAADRERIWANYHSQIDALDAKSHADALTRTAQREKAELDALEKIRKARVEALLKPMENTQEQIGELEFQKGLAKTTQERLEIEQQLGSLHAQRLDQARAALALADQEKMTDQERKQLQGEITKETRAMATSAAEVEKLQKDISKEIEEQVKKAQELNAKYAEFVSKLSDQSGDSITRAHDDLNAATAKLSEAYTNLLPKVEAYKNGTLKPEDYDKLASSMDTFLSALEKQKEKLEALRSEYDRQKDALRGVQDVLKSFGVDLGDEQLLNNAIDINQGTYDKSEAALKKLLQGGKYDAVQLNEATKDLQSSYGNLKEAVLAVGEQRAKQHEKEIERIRTETTTRTKAIDTQIEAAKKAGRSTADLEKEKDRITKEMEKSVNDLEGKAKKARDDAKAAFTDRTKGIQQLLGGITEASKKASAGVDDLERRIKDSEGKIKDSAARMRSSLTGAFTKIADTAGQQGKAAGQRFSTEFQAAFKKGFKLDPASVLSDKAQLERWMRNRDKAYLSAVTLARKEIEKALKPTTSSAGAGGRVIRAGTSYAITQTIYINGNAMTGSSSPTMRQLLRSLATEAENECRRRNR